MGWCGRAVTPATLTAVVATLTPPVRPMVAPGAQVRVAGVWTGGDTGGSHGWAVDHCLMLAH